MKRAARICLIGLILLGVAWFAARRYLTSHRLAIRIAAELASASGGPVEIDAVDVGLGGSSLHGLKLFEAGSPPASRPWLTIAHLETDLSVLDLLTGAPWP